MSKNTSIKQKKIPVNRKMEIQQFILQKGSCTIKELSTKFFVSEITIRRDVAELEKLGKIKSTHGGVIPVTAEKELFFDTKKTLYLKEKIAIAKACLPLIENGSTVFMNSGSTTQETARALLQSKEGIKIITNNYEIPSLTQSNSMSNKVIIPGGEYHSVSHSFGGVLFLSQLDNMYASYCILGVNGIGIKEGLTSSILYGVPINNKFTQQTKGKTIVVADSSKLNTVSSFKICNLSAVDVIVTDWNAPKNFVAELKKQKIKVIIAKEE